MATAGRAALLLKAAQDGTLRAQALASYPPAPWDYDALQALRTPHAEAALDTGRSSDAQETDGAVLVVGTAILQHPPGLDGQIDVPAVAVVGYYLGAPTLYQVVQLAPPAVTTPADPVAAVPVTLWDCFATG